MPEIQGFKKVQTYLKARKAKSLEQDQVSVSVGYTSAYAIFVHEDLQAHHTNGRAKFLEDPARRLSPDLARIVREALAKGATMLQALMFAGLRLQRESMREVPVDTGALKNSAFTRPDEGSVGK
jgi:hypothetical protein